MNELNASGVAAVCALDMFCMALLIGLYFVTRNITARSGRRVSGLIGIGIALYSLLLITNDIWIIGEYTGDVSIGVQYFVNSSYFLALSVAPALWFLHVSIEFGLPFGNNRVATVAVMAPAAFLSAISVTAYANNLLFCFDEAGKYVRGPFYTVFSILSYAYIIAAALIALVEYIRRRDRERLRALSMLFYAFFVILFGVLQNLTGFEFGVLGFTAGTVVYFAYLITRENNTQKNAIEEQQKALEEALSMAESSNRSKTTFLNNMSHDIRTPMNAVIGYTELATTHIDEKEKVSDYLKKIKQSSDHLLSLINDVLDMSRIEAGKVMIREDSENLNEAVQALSDIIRLDAAKKELTFSADVSGLRDADVICDRLRLNQVLLNVLSNSVKYTNRGGKITLTVEQTEKRAREDGSVWGQYSFRIADNGIGMSKEFLKTLYDPFTRASSSTVSGIQGTGLGMAITKNLIEMMGGTIAVESEEGKGTETTVTLDFRLAEGEKKASADEASAVSFEGKRILLVEDNELNREIATEVLTEEGFTVDTAEDGTVAVEILRTCDPGTYDLVLMDIQMPKMNGYEATRSIRAMDSEYAKTVPIVAMTANAFDEDRRAAFEAGMNEHIAKPIDVGVMKEKLAMFLATSGK